MVNVMEAAKQFSPIDTYFTSHIFQLTEILIVVRSITNLFVFVSVQQVMRTLRRYLQHVAII